MTYNKKRMLSYGVILISVLLAYFCRLVRPKNTFARNFADQCRNCIYLGLYCAWVIYLEKHVVHRKTRRCLTAIGCLMVFWFFVRTVKFHIFHDPLGEHICWYLYYIPMILIPVLGLSAALFFVEKDEEKTVRQIIILLTVAAVLIISVFTNDLHQLVFRFSKQPPFSDRDYSYGILFAVIQGWMLSCLTGMEIILIRKSRIPGKETVLAASHSRNIASGMECWKYISFVFHQNLCRGYDSSVLSFNGSNLSGLYSMRIDTDKQSIF